MIEIPARVAERAATHYELGDGCHISTYSIGSHRYAQVGWHDPDRRRTTTAHRASWTHRHGQIPEDMTVDHLCKVKRCDRLRAEKRSA